MESACYSCSRRLFIEGFGAFSAVALAGCVRKGESPAVKFGMVTDCHYADIPYAKRPWPVGDASYRDSAAKLAECIAVMNSERPDFVVELGDFKDLGPDRQSTVGYLDKIEGVFRGFEGDRYHVLGNHDLDALDKPEFLARVSNAGQTKALAHYSFERGGVRFVVLDACYNSRMEDYRPGNWRWDDANVPPEELGWLECELESAKGNVVVFCHQCLDPQADARHIVRNAADVRSAIEKCGKVCAVFTGHQHSGRMNKVNGIAYYSLRALVLNAGMEENSYATVDVYGSGNIVVTGYRKAESTRIV
jgi:alkaline phosphatase